MTQNRGNRVVYIILSFWRYSILHFINESSSFNHQWDEMKFIQHESSFSDAFETFKFFHHPIDGCSLLKKKEKRKKYISSDIINAWNGEMKQR